MGAKSSPLCRSRCVSPTAASCIRLKGEVPPIECRCECLQVVAGTRTDKGHCMTPDATPTLWDISRQLASTLFGESESCKGPPHNRAATHQSSIQLRFHVRLSRRTSMHALTVTLYIQYKLYTWHVAWCSAQHLAAGQEKSFTPVTRCREQGMRLSWMSNWLENQPSQLIRYGMLPCKCPS